MRQLISRVFSAPKQGDIVVFTKRSYGDESLVKVHFHTNEPWKLLEYAFSVGEIYDIVVEDMIRQSDGKQG